MSLRFALVLVAICIGFVYVVALAKVWKISSANERFGLLVNPLWFVTHYSSRTAKECRLAGISLAGSIALVVLALSI